MQFKTVCLQDNSFWNILCRCHPTRCGRIRIEIQQDNLSTANYITFVRRKMIVGNLFVLADIPLTCLVRRKISSSILPNHLSDKRYPLLHIQKLMVFDETEQRFGCMPTNTNSLSNQSSSLLHRAESVKVGVNKKVIPGSVFLPPDQLPCCALEDGSAFHRPQLEQILVVTFESAAR